MADELYYNAYEKRYTAAYEAGADFWGHTPEDEELNEVLEKWFEANDLKGKHIVEFMCGEGASGVILSKLGCRYTGIDIAPAAVKKAGSILEIYPDAEVILMDVVNDILPEELLPTEKFDAALDCMGFHMLVTDPDRRKYLKNAFRCLKKGAPMMFFREQQSEDAYDGDIDTFDAWIKHSNGDYTTSRQMWFRKDGEDIEIQIPYVPGRSKTKAGYTKELTECGFIIDSIHDMCESYKCGQSISITVHKA